MQPDFIPEFLNKVSPRIGPVNAIGLLRDAQLTVFRQLFNELGITNERMNEAVKSHLMKTAQDILNMPVPSPIARTF